MELVWVCCTYDWIELKKAAIATPARISRRTGAQPRERRQEGAKDGAQTDVHRADQDTDSAAKQQRQEASCGPHPGQPGHAAQDYRRCGGDADADAEHQAAFFSSCRTWAAIARMNSMIRGPHREATSSSTPITCPDLTAVIAPHPGRAATVLRSCWQHLVSASTIRSGFAATMYSADSWG